MHSGYFTTENSHAFRIICSTLCLTAVVIMNVYIARYTSDLTVKHYSFLVNSIEDAATKKYVMVHISKGTAAENFIMVNECCQISTCTAVKDWFV